MSNPPDDVDELDSALATTLDDYVVALQAGDEARCRDLLAAQPQLLEFVASVDALDRMSPDVAFAESMFGLLQDNFAATFKLAGLSTTDAEAAPVLRMFGRYELLEELGRGGMGVVFKARQTDLDRIVAVKMILVNRLASTDDIRRFYQEAKAAGRLTHPQIVGIHEVGEVHGQHFFSMECIDGPSLGDLLAGGAAASSTDNPVRDSEETDRIVRPTKGSRQDASNSTVLPPTPLNLQLTFEQAARILRDIARAVDFLHHKGIIHRDLKPSNILLASATGLPYLTDFGLAKCFSSDDEKTHSGAIVGTPLYMSPEQAAGRNADVGPASDVYSMGAILYQVLTGQVPHRGSSPMRTIVSVIEADPELPRSRNPEAPRELEAICLKCLEKDSANRYSTASELADDFERYLRGEPVFARSTGLVHHFRRWIRRDPALASRWAALFCGALILFWAFWFEEVTELKHWRLQTLIGLWAFSGFVFQKFVKQPEIASVSRYTWLATDAAFLTRILIIAGHPIGPLVVAYPLLIAASGLFFQEGLVYFMTSVSLISYAVLLWVVPEEAYPPHYCLIFSVVLIVIGLVLAHQVHRIRNLSRHFEG